MLDSNRNSQNSELDSSSLNDNEFVEAENGEENELLTLSHSPILFEPISCLTSVFFDRDNQQIFCVRSNGVGGVIVKGPRPDLNASFRMEDKGNVTTIKFSPNQAILAIRRRDKTVIDFLNFKNGQPAFPEYSQAFKAKNTKFQECYWLDANEILLVSEQGFEHYQIFAEKRALKLIKFFSMPLNWLIWSREAQVFIVSTGSYGSILNPFVYAKGAFIKLPKFEVDLPLPLNSVKYRYSNDASSSSSSSFSSSGVNSSKYYLNESDVVVGRIYNEFYVMIIRQMVYATNEKKKTSSSSPSPAHKTSSFSGYSEIAMYKLLTDSPAKKTNILKINLSGRFTLNIIDELVVVHDRSSYSSMIFDIKMPGEFDGYVTCNYPVISKAGIQRQSQFTASNYEIYSMNWIMFLPNTIIDAKIGFFWRIELNLSGEIDLRVFREIKDNYLKLIEFLLNRKFTKTHVIKACQMAIAERVSLKVIGQIFNKINELYKLYLILVANLNNQNLSENSNNSINNNNNNNNSSVASNMSNMSPSENNSPISSELENAQLRNLAIIEQYDMHNEILYPLVEGQDEKWWSVNAKYTIAVLIEYFRSLNAQHISIEHVLYKLLVNSLIKCNRQHQLHQYLQYHVLTDSKPLACLLLSIEDRYAGANQLALDMLKRLGTANEEIVDVMLSKGLVLSALRFSVQNGLQYELNAGKFLETAKHLNDAFIYHEVFKYFEDRNVRLRGNPNFRKEENCEAYVQHFIELYSVRSSNAIKK